MALMETQIRNMDQRKGLLEPVLAETSHSSHSPLSFPRLICILNRSVYLQCFPGARLGEDCRRQRGRRRHLSSEQALCRFQGIGLLCFKGEGGGRALC